jgi:endoglucanase
MNLLLLRTQRRRLVGMVVLTLVVAFLAIPALPRTASAAAAAPTIDPIVGDWNVTYGAPAVVTISGSSSAYTVTAKSPVRVTGSSCDLSPGTIIATFSGSGNTYSGQHGLWYTGDCSFGRWTSLSLALSGSTLTGVLGEGFGTVTFTKVAGTEFTCPATAPMLSAPNTSSPVQPLGVYTPQTASSATSGRPFSPLHTSRNQILDASGNPVKLASVNWYGAESPDFVPMGLDKQSLDAISANIASKGFNAVRLPWSNELVECNPNVSPSLVTMNQQFANQPAMTVFDAVVNSLATHGLMVILDNHMTDAAWCCSTSDSNDLWWSSKGNRSDYASGQSHWISDWATMVQRYANQPAIIGIDVRNEPRGASYWGGTSNGQPDGQVVNGSKVESCPVTNSTMACDWRSAAQQEGDAILGMKQNLLVFVEGVDYATDLTGAYTSPVALVEPTGAPSNQLVYSSHVYTFADYCNANSQAQCPVGSTWEGGAGDGKPPKCMLGPVPFPCTRFTTFNFLADWKGLARALDSQWGFLAESGDHGGAVIPVWVGEFGTTSWTAQGVPERIVPNSDQNRWFIGLVEYLKQRGFSWSYWALNGTVSDGGFSAPDRKRGTFEGYGLLNPNWSQPNSFLLKKLKRIQ